MTSSLNQYLFFDGVNINKALLYQIPQPLIVFNADTSIEYINPAFEELTGFSGLQLIDQKAPYPFWPENKVQQYARDFALILQGDFLLNRNTIQLVFTSKNEPLWVKIVSTLVRQQGQNRYIISSWTNITEQAIADEQLKRTEERFRLLIKNSQDIIYRINFSPGFEFEYVSESVKDISGYASEEYYLNPKLVFKIIFEEDRPKLLSIIKRPLENSGPFCLRFVRKDRKIIWLEQNIKLLFSDRGRITALEGIARNITERKEAEQAMAQTNLEKDVLAVQLKEIDEFNLGILENSPHPIVVHNPDYSIKYVNPAMAKLTGFPIEQLIGSELPYPWWIKEITPQYTLDFMKYINEGVTKHERQFQKKDGSEFWVEISSTLTKENGKVKYAVTNWTEITERKFAELRLNESDERFRQVARMTGEWIWETDQTGLYQYSNSIIEEMLGYTPAELVGKLHFYDLYPSELREKLRSLNFENFKKKQAIRSFINPHIHKDGRIRIMETNALPVLDGEGKVLGYRGTNRDVTEQKMAELELKESEERYASLFKYNPHAVYSMDMQGRFNSVNDACSRITG
jgi:PAS domain S-box-containing protein